MKGCTMKKRWRRPSGVRNTRLASSGVAGSSETRCHAYAPTSCASDTSPGQGGREGGGQQARWARGWGTGRGAAACLAWRTSWWWSTRRALHSVFLLTGLCTCTCMCVRVRGARVRAQQQHHQAPDAPPSMPMVGTRRLCLRALCRGRPRADMTHKHALRLKRLCGGVKPRDNVQRVLLAVRRQLDEGGRVELLGGHSARAQGFMV